MKRRSLVILGAVALLSTSACSKKATGQVVAVVNGEEISLSELNAELRGAPASMDKKTATAAALRQLIDRKLLVQRAKQQNLDKDPAFVQQQRRMNDDLLITLLGKKVTGNVPVPTSTAVNKFINDNPTMFAQRTIYSLDQILFPLPAKPADLKQLEPAKDMTAVGAVLDRMGIKYERKNGALDGAQTPPDLLTRVLALPAGEPFIMTANGRAVVSVIADKKLVPLSDADARALATETIRRKSLSDLAQNQLKDVRTSAKIEYQPGYEAAPPPATPAK